MKWAPECTPCTPAWWLDWGGCFNSPKCPPCSWSVPTCLPEPTAPMNPYFPFAPYAPPYPQYGWDNGCCAPPPPPYPAPYQVAANTPTPEKLYPKTCPLVYVGGACCEGCAKGEGCAATTQAAVGALGDALGGTGYPWSVAQDLNDQIELLNADIGKMGGPATQVAWAGFYPSWRQWYAEKRDSVAATFGIVGDNAKQFEAYDAQFSVLLEQSKAAGVQTSAKPVDTKSPLQQGAEQGGAAAGAAAGAVGTGLVYLAVAGAVLAGLYLGGPTLLKAVTKRKAA